METQERILLRNTLIESIEQVFQRKEPVSFMRLIDLMICMMLKTHSLTMTISSQTGMYLRV